MISILAIDDQRSNLVAVEALLTNLLPGCKVITAQSGIKGIELAIQKQPDTILLDIVMPEMDGYEVCKILKSNKQTSTIPIILASAMKNNRESKVKGLKAGADVFLSKPYSPEELLAQVASMLRIRKAEKALIESEQKYRLLFENMLSGFALHKIITDNTGKPIDYLFLEVNNGFEKLTGLSREEIINKKVTEVIPGIENDPADWINQYGNVALTSKEMQFEDYSEPLKKWFSVYAFCPKKNYFAVIFTETTKQKKAKQEIIKLSTAVKQSPSVIAITDLKGNFEYVNPKFSKQTGYSYTEVIGKSTKLLNSSNQSSEFYKELWETISFGNDWKGEFRNIKKNGDLYWESASISPIFNSEGKIINYVKVAEDITKRKKADAEIKYQADLLQKVTDAIIATNENEEIISWNKAAETMYGWKANEVIGKKASDVIIHKYPNQTREAVMDHFYEQGFWKGDVIQKRKDGTLLNVIMSVKSTKDDAENFNGAVAIIHDITERNLAEQELKNNQIFLNRIIDQSPFATWVSDEKGTIIRCNAALEDILNVTKEQLVGKYNVFEDKLAKEDGIIPKIRTVFENGKTANFLVEWDPNRLGYEDSKKVLIEGTMFPIHDEKGNLTNVVNHWIDITAHKQAEEALKASEERLRNLTVYMDTKVEEEKKHISREIHDGLGQMLTGLKMDLMWTKKNIPEIKTQINEKFESMKNNIDSSVQLVQNISMQLRPKMLDDLGLADTILWELTEFKERSGINYEYNFELNNFSIDFDRSTTIFRILLEILTNIYRHSGASEIEIELRKRKKDIVLEVHDNGKGISMDEINSNLSFGIIGIMERVNVWKGDAKFTGKKGKGTTVTITIPA